MQKGDLVVATTDFTARSDSTWPYLFDISEGATGVITSVRSAGRVRVKFDEPFGAGRAATASARRFTCVVDCSTTGLDLQDSEAQAAAVAERARLAEEARLAAEAAAERKRKEREAKEAAMKPKEGDILPNDPRIQWLWAQIADYAEKQNWCGTYDEVTDKFGIPGRERQFRTTFVNAGLEMTTQVRGHNPQEVKQKVLEAMPGATKIEVGRGV